MSKPAVLRRMPLLLLLAVPGVRPGAQSPQATAPADELSRTLASLDAELFASAYACDLERFGALFAEDVEFYHDQSGVTLGRKSLLESIKQNLCGKVRRELVPGTLQAYPMHGYGAVQTGVHRFHQPKAPSEPVGEARFVHLWQRKDGVWRITRVISYDHRALPK